MTLEIFPGFSPDIFPSVSEAEYQRRYAAIRELMAERGLDCLIVYGDSGYNEHNQANIHYITNYSHPYPCYLLFPMEGEPSLYMMGGLHNPHARRMSRLSRTEGVAGNLAARLVIDLKEMGLERGRLGLVGVARAGILNYDQVMTLKEGLPQATFEKATDLMFEVRRIKSAEEIEWFRRGAELTDMAVSALEEQAREGMTECELHAILTYAYMKEEGGWPKTIFIGSTSMRSPDLVFPRQKPSRRVIGKGDVIVMELSCGHWQYAGQLQRPMTVGEPPTPQYQELFDIASEVYYRIVDALGPGTTEQDVIRAGSIMKERGVWTFDGLLHGWGVGIEPPGVDVPGVPLLGRAPQRPVAFEPGMTVVVQPNIVSHEKNAGLQVGNLVVITETGCEPLQKYPIKFAQVG